MPGHRPPVLGEPLALELANTRFKHRGTELDGLRAPPDLADWLLRVRDRLPVVPSQEDIDAVGPAELSITRDLRDALRTLLDDATAGDPCDADAAETLNRTVRAAPRWLELDAGGPRPAALIHAAAAPVTAALAAIAEQAVALLSGPDAATLRACSAPGCMLFYRKDHPRRAWCSPRCSNRVRAARHYARRTAAS